jgi:shikimate kinase
MGRAAPKPCAHPGCPAVVPASVRFCPDHAKGDKRQKFFDDEGKKLSASQRGYGSRWTKFSKWYRTSVEPLCRECSKEGNLTPAQVVDHIEPVEGPDDPRFFDQDEVQSLCRACHNRKTALEDGRHGGSLFRPIFKMPGCKVIMVCGAPGSGKSTWAKEQAGEHDLIIDLDEIIAEITGLEIYQAQDKDSLYRGLTRRNHTLQGLHSLYRGKVYFIYTGGLASQRRWWKKVLNANEVIIDTPLKECIARIKKDARRPAEVKERHIKAAFDWWKKYLKG